MEWEIAAAGAGISATSAQNATTNVSAGVRSADAAAIGIAAAVHNADTISTAITSVRTAIGGSN